MKDKATKILKITNGISCVIAVGVLLAFNIINNKYWHLNIGLYLLVDAAILALWILFNFLIIKITMKKIESANKDLRSEEEC